MINHTINHMISAVIPAYNEENNIAGVLEALQQSPLLSEIIVVDDGSRDRTAQIAEGYGVRVIRFNKNQGKAQAMIIGAQSTAADIIFFADADLIGMTPDHVAAVMSPVIRGEAGMSVGIRGWGKIPLWFMNYCIPVIGGERAILKKHFLTLAAHPTAQRFGIETVMNTYCARHHIPVILVRMHGVSIVRKEQKIGFLKGFSARLRMFGQILRTEILLLFDRRL